MKAIFAGVGVVDNSLFDPGSSWYNPENASAYTYDRRRRRRCFAKAGYPDGFEMSMPVFSTVQQVTEGSRP